MKKQKKTSLLKPQKYLGTIGLFVLIISLNMIGPLTTDMYLPSLPTIAHDYNLTTTEANITLISYFLCTTFGILIIGPSSDRFGRKYPLVLSIFVYMLSSLGCFAAPNLGIMVISRCIQGLGAGGMVSISTAIIKDSFSGKTRGIALSIVQAMFIIAPIVAPLLGSAVILVFTWNYVFLILGIIGAIMLLFALLYQETIPNTERISGNFLLSYKGTLNVVKNKRFMFLLISSSIFCTPFMAYLSTSTYIYQETFSCSPQEFSMFFSIASSVMIVGSLLSLWACKNRTKTTTILFISIAMCAGLTSSILLLTVGSYGPIFFLCSFVVYFVAHAFCRPYVTDILLSQHSGDTGSATAVLNFCINAFCLIGMILGSIQWSSYIDGVGWIMLISVIIAAILWAAILKTKQLNTDI